MSAIAAGRGRCYLSVMIARRFENRDSRGTLVALDDRARLPWRFLARHMAIDGLSG